MSHPVAIAGGMTWPVVAAAADLGLSPAVYARFIAPALFGLRDARPQIRPGPSGAAETGPGPYRHCFSSSVHWLPGRRPSLMKASTTFFSIRDDELSKSFAGSDCPKPMEPVEKTAPLFQDV